MVWRMERTASGALAAISAAMAWASPAQLVAGDQTVAQADDQRLFALQPPPGVQEARGHAAGRRWPAG